MHQNVEIMLNNYFPGNCDSKRLECLTPKNSRGLLATPLDFPAVVSLCKGTRRV